MTKSRCSSKNTITATAHLRCIESSHSSISEPTLISERPNGSQSSQFLDLPGEIRSAIYSAAFLDSENGLPILQTCQQINMESTAVLHQRPITFSSQAKLFTWIAETRGAEIRRVKSITLHLTDIDLSSLFDPRQITDKRGGRSISCWYLYSQELLRLDQALQTLAGLVDLTVVPPEPSTSLVRGMYLSFLEVIPQRCPKLRLLTLYDQETLLQKVPALTNLSKVAFLSMRDTKSYFPVPVKAESIDQAVKIKRESEW